MRERGSTNVAQTIRSRAEEQTLKKYYGEIEEQVEKMCGDNEALKNKVSSYFVSLLKGNQKVR